MTGISTVSPAIRSSSAFSVARSALPGAYPRTGSLAGRGMLLLPFIGLCQGRGGGRLAPPARGEQVLATAASPPAPPFPARVGSRKLVPVGRRPLRWYRSLATMPPPRATITLLCLLAALGGCGTRQGVATRPAAPLVEVRPGGSAQLPLNAGTLTVGQLQTQLMAYAD